MGLGTGAIGRGVRHFLLSCRTSPKCNAFETPFIFSDLLFTVPFVVGARASQKLMKQKVAWLNASHGVKVEHFLQHIHKNNSLHSFLLLKRRDLEKTTNLKRRQELGLCCRCVEQMVKYVIKPSENTNMADVI